MNIKSFSRMKSYRRDGRLAVVLKLTLPHSDDKEKHGVFDIFYNRLAEKYFLIAEHVPYSGGVGCRPSTVSVGYSIISDEYIKKHPNIIKKHPSVIAIKRKVNIKSDGNTRLVEYLDLYDCDIGFFIK